MPGIDHDVHPSTQRGSTARYGCYNRPRPQYGAVVVSRFNHMQWPYMFSTECRYDLSLTDESCLGCQWRGVGEAYNEELRHRGS